MLKTLWTRKHLSPSRTNVDAITCQPQVHTLQLHLYSLLILSMASMVQVGRNGAATVNSPARITDNWDPCCYHCSRHLLSHVVGECNFCDLKMRLYGKL